MEDLLLDSNLYTVYSEDSFDVSNLSNYRLCLRVHQSSLSIGVYEADTNRCLALEAYHFDRSNNNTALIVRLHNIIQRHSYVNAAFWKEVVVLLAHHQYTVAPESFIYDDESAVSILRMNSLLNVHSDIVNITPIHHLNAKLIYTLDQELKSWFEKLYPNTQLRFTHTIQPFLSGATSFYQEDTLYVHADVDSVCISKFNSPQELAFVNTFNYKTEKDLIYFILFVMEELKMNPKKSYVHLWGQVTSKSGLIPLLEKYIKGVTLGKRPANLRFPYEFDQEPEEQVAFDLLNMLTL